MMEKLLENSNMYICILDHLKKKKVFHMSNSIGRVFKVQKDMIFKKGRDLRFESWYRTLIHCNKVFSC